MNIKIRPADTKFSLYLRALRKWTCESCGRVCRSADGKTIYWKLEACHYFSRRHESTRFDEDNVRAFCFQCHQRMGGYTPREQGEFDVWMKEKLGSKYKLLKVMANTFHKKDDSQVLLWLKNV